MRSEALRGGKTKTQRSKFNSLCPNPLCVTISNLESICLILIPTHKGNHSSRCTVSSSDCGQLTIIRINSSALFLLRRWQPPERRMFQSTPRLHREISPTASLREGVRFSPPDILLVESSQRTLMQPQHHAQAGHSTIF